MSTHSITVSGPSTALAMLRALAIKAGHHVRHLLTSLRLTLTGGSRLLRSAASTALAALGSSTGYHLARSTTRRTLTSLASITGAAARLAGHVIKAAGRAAAGAVSRVSPATARSMTSFAVRWIGEPLQHAASHATDWAATVWNVLWHLTGTRLVQTATTRAAQIAGLAVGMHVLSQGALASTIVSALPWTMNAVVWITQPTTALVLVAGAFLASLLTAGILLATSGSSPDPDDGMPHTPGHDSGTPRLLSESASRAATAVDPRSVAARLNVDVAPDGTVVVHGIPDDLPEELALHVAHIAADAATDRLRRILLHRPAPNRDDKRMMTKAARDAVRRTMTAA